MKLERSDHIEVDYVVGRQISQGIEIAREKGIDFTIDSIQDLLQREGIEIAFDSTGAVPHTAHAPLLKEAGIFAVDLTPAAIGPYCVPAVNLTDDLLEGEVNLNMVTCAGQATVPIVAAINQAVGVAYAEVVSSVSSMSAGPGTRQNIDEFTVTTAHALEKVGGADQAKVIIVLNPAEPPIFMRNTIYTQVKDPDMDKIKRAVDAMLIKIQQYVPGYTLLLEPIIEGDVVTTMVQVEGLGDFLPIYAGNLDIINSAAVAVGEAYAKKKRGL